MSGTKVGQQIITDVSGLNVTPTGGSTARVRDWEAAQGGRLDALESHTSGWVNVASYGASPSASAATNDAAFAAAKAALTPGMELRAGGGTYNLSAPLDLSDLPRYSRVVIEGALLFTGDIAGVTVNGFQTSVFINSIVSSGSASTKAGLTIKSLRQSKLHVRNIDGFRDSVHTIGKYDFHGLLGCSENEIRVDSMVASTVNGYCCKLTTEQNDAGTIPGYLNENHFYLGYMQGYRGVSFIKGTGQVDPFNGNAFWKPQFELFAAGSTAMELNFAHKNSVIFPRFEGSQNPDSWITEASDCTSNVYLLNGTLTDSKFTFGGKTAIVVGQFIDAGGDVLYAQRFGGTTDNTNHVYLAQSKRTNTKNGTVYFGNVVTDGDLFTKWAGGVRDLTGAHRKFGLLDPLGVQTITGTQGDVAVQQAISLIDATANGSGILSLNMPAGKEIEGFSIDLKVRPAAQALSLKRSDGTLDVTAGSRQISAPGMYRLTFQGGAWKATKVADRLDGADAVSADRGDTNQTLTVGTDAEIQRWATTLTANRTVTLSTTNAQNGSRFRVVRTGLGAFTLDVGGLKTIPSATAAFMDVAYNGSAWVLTGYGTL